ncbi:hypothetical protein FOCC_FOCC000778, partial [Frankliniella occidentalis]
MLSGTVHRYYIYHNYPKAYTLLLFQPDRALRANSKHGRVRFHAPAGLGREALTRRYNPSITDCFPKHGSRDDASNFGRSSII